MDGALFFVFFYTGINSAAATWSLTLLMHLLKCYLKTHKKEQNHHTLSPDHTNQVMRFVLMQHGIFSSVFHANLIIYGGIFADGCM